MALIERGAAGAGTENAAEDKENADLTASGREYVQAIPQDSFYIQPSPLMGSALGGKGLGKGGLARRASGVPQKSIGLENTMEIDDEMELEQFAIMMQMRGGAPGATRKPAGDGEHRAGSKDTDTTKGVSSGGENEMESRRHSKGSVGSSASGVLQQFSMVDRAGKETEDFIEAHKIVAEASNKQLMKHVKSIWQQCGMGCCFNTFR